MVMKRYIKALTVIALFAFLVTGCQGFTGITPDNLEMLSPSGVQQAEGNVRKVQVSGTGELQVEPDTAVIRLGVQTEADSAQAALRQNNSQMQTLMSSLEDANIPAEDIQTQTIRLSPRYEFDNAGENRTLVGYTASNVLEVRTENLDEIGTLLDRSVESGANTIENIRFEISTSEDLSDRARENAVQNARHKAEQLAELTNATLGPVLEIQESSNTPGPVVRQVDAPAEAAAVPISPGSQNISVQVQITWSLITSNGQ
jgi:hypothetical protein